MFDRNKAIELITDDDIDTIVDIVAREHFCYLHHILVHGMKGYNNFTDEELMQELEARGFPAPHLHEEIERLMAERDALVDALRWIAVVNAMDYEYQAKARAAIAALGNKA